MLSCKCAQYPIIRSITMLLGFLINTRIHREIYRRKECCLHWLNQNMKEISEALQNNTVNVIYNNKIILLLPPTKNKENQAETEKENVVDKETLFSFENDLDSFDQFDVFIADEF